MRLAIEHTTRYQFDAPVSYGLQQLRKTPKNDAQQDIVTWETEIKGGRQQLSFEDHHRNTVDLVSFEKGTSSLLVTSRGEVEVKDSHGVVGPHKSPAPLWLYKRQTSLTSARAGVRSLVKDMTAHDPLETLNGLSATIAKAVIYKVDPEQALQPAEEVLKLGQGVCQDHTHIFLACARELGIAARYVSGYLLLDDRSDQCAMHAWAEAHVEGLGWVGFDVSNGISPDARYVRVATGLDYRDAAPITGMRVGGDAEVLSVDIQVAQQ